MKTYGMRKYSFHELWKRCQQQQVSALIWIDNNIPKYLPCGERVVGTVLWAPKKLLLSFMVCSIKLPNVMYAFDNSDYAVPHSRRRSGHDWLITLPGIVRYAGTPSHPALLFPVAEYVRATTHCNIKRRSHKIPLFTTCVESWTSKAERECTQDNWDSRLEKAYWIGAFTGSIMKEETIDFNPRYRLAKDFRNRPGYDIHFTAMPMPSKRIGEKAFQLWNDSTGRYRPATDYCKYKLVIHADGNSFAGSIGYKLTSGATILFIDSHFKFKEFYYGLLQPWVHYIPIDPDLNNLENIKEWIFTTKEGEEIARNISRNARKLVKERLTPEATYCYILRLFNSLAGLQSEEPTAEALSRADIPVEKFKIFEEYYTLLNHDNSNTGS
uniref:Glycosyl transferase CAP10 domain-containing protein n=1 Tax=Aplanochytrium stocchinoi TaxID=215587 RepID=A0A7S3V1C5_9STRA